MFWKIVEYLQNFNMIINNNNEIPPAGLEPATFGSTVQRSAKLS